jgi:hypothetical protein
MKGGDMKKLWIVGLVAAVVIVIAAIVFCKKSCKCNCE